MRATASYAVGAAGALVLIAALPRLAAAQCSSTAPATGESVTCSGSSNTRVLAVPGSSNVAIGVDPGASIAIVQPPTAMQTGELPILSVANSSTITNNGTLMVSGNGQAADRGVGMLGTNNNTLTNNGIISTTNNFNIGMAVATNGSGNTLVNNGTIMTTGSSSVAISTPLALTAMAGSNNTVINNGTITTLGAGARGIFASGSNQMITNTGTIQTAGNNSAYGVNMLGNMDVLTNSGTIKTTGTGSQAVLANTVSSSFVATINNLPGGQIIATNAPAVQAVNGRTTINNAGLIESDIGQAITPDGGTGPIFLNLMTGSQIIGTANGGPNAASTVTLTGSGTADNPFVNFPTLNMAGDTWNFSGTGTFTTANVQTGTLNLTGTLGNATNVNVSPGATLNMQGVSQTFGAVTHAGTIMTGATPTTAPGTTLTAGNYIGVMGSELVLNTFVAGDGSPSDKLVVTGASSGSSSIIINNVSGPGQITTGNGILVVMQPDTDGFDAAFELDEPVRAGALSYRLVRGGVGGVDPNDWFLVSSFIQTPPGSPVQTPPGLTPPTEEPPGFPRPPEPLQPVIIGPPFPTRPVPPPAPGSPPLILPIIGPELATYGVVQPIGREMGLMTLDTLQQRSGDPATEPCWMAAPVPVYVKAPAAGSADGTVYTKAPPDAADCRPTVWGRFFGQEVNNHYEAFADPRASGWMGGFEGGVDLYRGSLWGGGYDFAGIYFAYDNALVGVSGLVTNEAITAYELTHTGTLDLNGYTVGGYWTHYGPTGWYFDAVVQGTWYDGRAVTQSASLETRGTGLVTSLEGGYPIPMPVLGPGFVLEPQAQIIWQEVAFGNDQDRFGAVDLGTTSGATGRLGLRGQWSLLGADGELWQPFVRANVWRDWNAQATTTFGTDTVPLNIQATRLEFAGGLTTRVNDRLSFQGQAGYQFGISQTTLGVARNAIMVDVGLQYAW